MNKRVFGRKLSRNTQSRKALFRTLIRALTEHGEINTTLAKAKAISGEVDKLMTLVAKNTVSTRRLVLAKLANDKVTTAKLFESYIEFTKTRKSGFTRIIKLPVRKGDAAQIARIEWVDKLKESKK